MTFIELSSAQELSNFVSSNPQCVVTFSAHWCGPCRSSKPQLQELARSSPVPIGYVYESDIGEALHTYGIKAFPSYVMFVSAKEVDRVQGVNFAALQSMISKHATAASAMPETGGNTLGGSHSAAEARALRLAKLEEASKEASKEAATDTNTTDDKSSPMDTSDEPVAPAPTSTDGGDIGDGKSTTEDAAMEDATKDDTGAATKNPVDDLDKEALKTLTEQMGFTLLRAQKGLLFSKIGTVESAVEWLMEHQDDADIDEPIPEGATGEVAQSYKCNECGKILSNMANLELHANKTGHSDFEESTQSVKPLTPEEKAAKIAEIKSLLKAKRAEREEAEKVDNVEREKQRRFMGKEVAKTREQMEMEQRKREAAARKREKIEQKRERERIRAELEKDKRERMANKGKLSSKLGVDGYNPDGIQYELKADGADDEEPASQKPKTSHKAASAAKIDEYITKVSSYRAGGDGGKCLKVLKLLVGNAADNPADDKYKKVNMETNAYKNKVKPFVGAKNILLAVGFTPQEGDPTHLVLRDDADYELLKETKEKLEKALVAYG
mmetsp:Transcript_43552/g.105585  ORF Transcript_43552/g.105585 Transcript_43552/m.105585 type:complete len:555 (+) Transcript_43552:149-1813(+)